MRRLTCPGTVPNPEHGTVRRRAGLRVAAAEIAAAGVTAGEIAAAVVEGSGILVRVNRPIVGRGVVERAGAILLVTADVIDARVAPEIAAATGRVPRRAGLAAGPEGRIRHPEGAVAGPHHGPDAVEQ